MQAFKQYHEDQNLNELADNDTLTKHFQKMSKKQIRQWIKDNRSTPQAYRAIVIAKKVLAGL